MSVPPHNAFPRPDAGGQPAPSLVVPQNPNDDPFESRERNAKRRKTEGSATVPMMTNIRSRICAKFDVEMGDNLRETLTSMWSVLGSLRRL